jgi:hypothetical protein
MHVRGMVRKYAADTMAKQIRTEYKTSDVSV